MILDSIGIKVFGEEEWKVRRHGYTKHRMWNKLHIAIDTETGDIIAEQLTTNSVTEADAGVELLNDMEEDIADVRGDGGYDNIKIFRKCHKRKIKTLIVPQKNARIRGNGDGRSPWKARDDIVKAIRREGRGEWKRSSGYSLRSLIETTMFRYKTIFGDKPLAYEISNQKIEPTIKCGILNLYTELGKPDSYIVVM